MQSSDPLALITAFTLVYDLDEAAPPLSCCRDIVNFFHVFLSAMFAAALVVCLPQFCLPPGTAVYFQAIGCCWVVIKSSSSVKVLLF